MKKSLRKKIQKSVSVITIIACLMANTFVYVPGAAAGDPNGEICDTVSENEEIPENHEIGSGAEENSAGDINGEIGSDGSGSVVEAGISEELNVNEKIAPGEEEKNTRQYGEAAAMKGGYRSMLVKIQMETLRISNMKLSMEM